jgi:hypothetical protein
MAGYNANVLTITVGDQMSGEISQYVAADIQVPEGTGELPAGEAESKPAEDAAAG